jgi:hypothetical protein
MIMKVKFLDKIKEISNSLFWFCNLHPIAIISKWFGGIKPNIKYIKSRRLRCNQLSGNTKVEAEDNP